MEEFDRKLFDYFKENNTVPNKISDAIFDVDLKNKVNTKSKETIKLDINTFTRNIILTLLSIFALTGGIAFAANHFWNFFRLGKGIDTAVENGYIYSPIDNYERIKASGVETSIQDFLMDDQNISTNFSFTFSNEVLENLDIENIKTIELRDLIITDENNVILYCANENALNRFCKTNNLNYKFMEFNENYFNCGLNSFLQSSSKNDMICLTYNIYSNNYPKSRKLKYEFHEIVLRENKEENSKGKIIEGNWSIDIEVPEKMYNRKDITYSVVDCSDENVEISTAKASDTGFEFGCTFKNIELPEEIKNIREEIKILSEKELTPEEMKELALKDMELDEPPVKKNYSEYLGETIENCTYIENNNNNKFLISTNPGRLQKGDFIDDDTGFVFYETFDLTKYDITNELTVHLKFYDKSITVKLRRNE